MAGTVGPRGQHQADTVSTRRGPGDRRNGASRGMRIPPRSERVPSAGRPQTSDGGARRKPGRRAGPPQAWIAAAVLLLAVPAPALAYVGPGAGFAFVSSLLIILVTTLLAILTLLTWPIRWVVQRIRGSRALGAARARRVIVLGLDGQDPELTEQFLAEGLLPNFARLRERGTFTPLPDDASRRVPGRLDVVPDRLQPRQAPHLRLPGAEPRRRTSPSSAPRASTRRPAPCGSAPTASPSASRASAPVAAACRSGRSSATTESSAPSCACRSRSRPSASAACCCRR